jgi:hypothetical protein
MITFSLSDEAYSSKPENQDRTCWFRNCHLKPPKPLLSDLLACIGSGYSFLPNWSAYNLTGNENFYRSNLLVMDIDNANQKLTIPEFLKISEDKGFPVNAAYETFSSTPVHPKFRVIYLLDAQLPKREYHQLLQGIHSDFEGIVDPATKDICHRFYGTNKATYLYHQQTLATTPLIKKYQTIVVPDYYYNDPEEKHNVPFIIRQTILPKRYCLYPYNPIPEGIPYIKIGPFYNKGFKQIITQGNRHMWLLGIGITLLNIAHYGELELNYEDIARQLNYWQSKHCDTKLSKKEMKQLVGTIYGYWKRKCFVIFKTDTRPRPRTNLVYNVMDYWNDWEIHHLKKWYFNDTLKKLGIKIVTGRKKKPESAPKISKLDHVKHCIQEFHPKTLSDLARLSLISRKTLTTYKKKGWISLESSLIIKSEDSTPINKTSLVSN